MSEIERRHVEVAVGLLAAACVKWDDLVAGPLRDSEEARMARRHLREALDLARLELEPDL